MKVFSGHVEIPSVYKGLRGFGRLFWWARLKDYGFERFVLVGRIWDIFISEMHSKTALVLALDLMGQRTRV